MVVAAVLFLPVLQPVAVCSAECSEPAALPTTGQIPIIDPLCTAIGSLVCSMVFGLLDSVLGAIMEPVLGMVPSLMGKLPDMMFNPAMETVLRIFNALLVMLYKTGLFALISMVAGCFGSTIASCLQPCTRIPYFGLFVMPWQIFLRGFKYLGRPAF